MKPEGARLLTYSTTTLCTGFTGDVKSFARGLDSLSSKFFSTIYTKSHIVSL